MESRTEAGSTPTGGAETTRTAWLTAVSVYFVGDEHLPVSSRVHSDETVVEIAMSFQTRECGSIVTQQQGSGHAAYPLPSSGFLVIGRRPRLGLSGVNMPQGWGPGRSGAGSRRIVVTCSATGVGERPQRSPTWGSPPPPPDSAFSSLASALKPSDKRWRGRESTTMLILEDHSFRFFGQAAHRSPPSSLPKATSRASSLRLGYSSSSHRESRWPAVSGF